MYSIYNQKKGGDNETYTIPWFKQVLYTFVVVFAAACSKQSCPLQMDGRQSESGAKSNEQASPQHAPVDQEQKECRICLGECDDLSLEGMMSLFTLKNKKLKPDDPLICNHTFHLHCIGRWIVQEKKHICPLCNTALDRKDIKEIKQKIKAVTEPWFRFIRECIGGRSEHIEHIKKCLSVDPILVNQVNKDGNTALHLAAEQGHLEIMTLLLGNEADMNQVNKDGNTALHLAVPGIDVNKKNEYGSTALHIAAQNGHTEVVKVLLSVPGIDANKKNNYGSTRCIMQLRMVL